MDYTLLVNKYHKINEEEIAKIEKQLTKNNKGEDVLLEKNTLFHYEKLKEFLKTKGLEIGINSGFRNLLRQEELREEYLEKYGADYVRKYVAKVGCSEHHTGLAIDIAVKRANEDPKEQEEDLYLEVHPYLSKFGFILRYPKGKEKITGYNYEPWHIRYVGKEVATLIMDKNSTLEEYFLKQNSGVLLVNKEKDMTSRDVVNIVGKALGIKKVGHTGTLDPIATGLLVITVGQATKIGELLVKEDKEYIASFKLGNLTDTLDITGKVLDTKEVPNNIDINPALKHFETTYLQEVPIYSAVKVKGKKLYEYARNSEFVDLPKKEVTIKKIELLAENDGEYVIKCLVSKGTYIRSLIRDIGLYLNTYATMTSLERTYQSGFKLEDAYSLEQIRNKDFKLIKVVDALDIEKEVIDGDLLFKVQNGVILKEYKSTLDKIMFIDKDNNMIAIYEKCDDIYKPWKVFS